MEHARYLADFSLALLNRTGAYFVCRDVLAELPHFFEATRYWRAVRDTEPGGILRLLLRRQMLWELDRLASRRLLPRPGHPRRRPLPTVFFDPLYVLRTDLRRSDIVLCHDIGPVTHPDLYNERTVARYVAAYDKIHREKPGVVFVSAASRREFVSRFGEDFRFLEVIPLYVRSGVRSGDEQSVPGVRRPFLLTVGALQPRKNHARIMAAFQQAALNDRGYSYVVCGPRGMGAEETVALAKATPGVQVLGYLGDAQLRWLYRNASGFVLPSLLEGFGLPALEAAQQNLLSVVGRGGAQEEAVDGGAILVDPTSVDSIADGLLRLVDMPDHERSDLLARAARQASALSRERYIERWSRLLASSAMDDVDPGALHAAAA